MIGVWLFYNYADMVIDIVNSKEFKSDLGHALAEETPTELKTIKRWSKISFVLLSGAGIIGQLCGLIGGVRGYIFMVNAHVFINLFVVFAHVLLFICAFAFTSITINQTHTFDMGAKIGGITFLVVNITVGWLFRRDINMIRHREKLSRCTCSYIAAAQAQFAAQQQQAQQQQQYITGPDGSRYMIARPTPIGGGGSRLNGGNGNGNGGNGPDGDNGNGGGGGGGGGGNSNQWPIMPPGGQLWP
ncbi:hypothetical protein TYRP_011827 [Tyrophagus putrescentiae]|nr:hypothetical protein TYRP_011827 [Tyrophagus putrescentiae]